MFKLVGKYSVILDGIESGLCVEDGGEAVIDPKGTAFDFVHMDTEEKCNAFMSDDTLVGRE